MNEKGTGLDYWSNLLKLVKARHKMEEDKANNTMTGREWDSLTAKHKYEVAKIEAMKLFHGQNGHSQNVSSLSEARTSQPRYSNLNGGYEE